MAAAKGAAACFAAAKEVAASLAAAKEAAKGGWSATWVAFIDFLGLSHP